MATAPKKTANAKPAAHAKDKLSIHEALIYIMVAAAAIDRRIKDVEVERIGSIVRFYPIFRTYDEANLPRLAAECSELLSRDPSLRTFLDLVTAAVPRRLHEAAYALAIEVSAADLKGAYEEIKLLDHLADRFNLDRLITAAIERSATARHETL